MESQNKQSNSHQAFEVISLVLGILGFIFSFIPCFGAYAIYVGVAGLGCGIAGLILAKKVQAGIGLSTAGILLSALACAVALWQIIKLNEARNAAEHWFH